MSNLQAPQFLVNVYRDLRDRRLLLPAALLAAALVIVPVVLGKSSSAPPPAPPPAKADTDSAATVPAVFTEQGAGVRNYRERLDVLKSTNPFRQRFQLASVKDFTLSTDGSAGDSSVTVDGTAGSTTSSGGAPASTPGVSVTGPAPDSTTPPSSGSGDTAGGSTPKPDVKVVNRLFTRRIDVKVGVQGSLERRKNVKQLEILPSESAPVLAFLGVSEEGDRAAFVVSADATPVSGDGSCVPSDLSCMFIALEPGESYTFDYTPDGLTYKLKLQRIRDVQLKND